MFIYCWPCFTYFCSELLQYCKYFMQQSCWDPRRELHCRHPCALSPSARDISFHSSIRCTMTFHLIYPFLSCSLLRTTNVFIISNKLRQVRAWRKFRARIYWFKKVGVLRQVRCVSYAQSVSISLKVWLQTTVYSRQETRKSYAKIYAKNYEVFYVSRSTQRSATAPRLRCISFSLAFSRKRWR